MSAARDLLAVLLLTAAAVLGTIWIPATWVERNVVDADGFLTITGPLADDAGFQRTLTDDAVKQVLHDDQLPQWASKRVTPFIQDQAAKATDTALYARLWRETMVQLHGALFEPGASKLDVDLDPVVEDVVSGAEEAIPFDLPFDLPRPKVGSLTLATIPDVPLLTRAAALDPWAHRCGPLALVLAAAGMLVGVHRRTLLVVLGALTALGGGAVCLLADRVEQLVPDLLDRAVFVGPLVQVFEQRFAAETSPQGVVLMGVGALAAALGIGLIGIVRRSGDEPLRRAGVHEDETAPTGDSRG